MIRPIKSRDLLFVMARTCCSKEKEQTQKLNVEYSVIQLCISVMFIRDTKNVIVIPAFKSFCFSSNLKVRVCWRPGPQRTSSPGRGPSRMDWPWPCGREVDTDQAGKCWMVTTVTSELLLNIA